MSVGIEVDRQKIAEFCEKWKITEFSLFGSVLTDDFRPDSDVDVLVRFGPDAHWSLFDMVGMELELQDLFGRKVDLVSRRGVEASRNPLRRAAILSSAQVIHAA